MLMKKKVIQLKGSLTFSDYFDLNLDIEDILAYFGYAFHKEARKLPTFSGDLMNLEMLETMLESNLLNVSLNNEVAKREFLIAPILSAVANYTHASIKVEYPVVVNEQLKGKLDYYVSSKNDFLIIEAKNADLEKGLIQLAVELIALDVWFEDEQTILYGAVSVGNIWQFAILDRANKQVIQDVNLFKIPTELEELMRVLIAILKNQS
jgi:hypothetical protein